MTLAENIFQPSPRPVLRRPETWEHVAKKLAPKVRAWILETDDDEPDLAKIEEDLRYVFDRRFHSSDSYELAKELERKGYGSDAELVDLMNDAEIIALNFQSKEEQAWVAHFGILPRLAKDTAVKVEYRGKEYVGSILSIDSKRGYYTIQIAELGHGKPQGGMTTRGINYAFEVVEKLNSEETARQSCNSQPVQETPQLHLGTSTTSASQDT